MSAKWLGVIHPALSEEADQHEKASEAHDRPETKETKAFLRREQEYISRLETKGGDA
jgi:hypothetical protein